jgi:hypothetical protein
MAHDTRRRKDDRIEFFLPAEDIEFDVLASDIKCYLGPEASVSVGVHHRDGRAGYYIKTYVAVTTAMIADLKADSRRWREEQQTTPSAAGYPSSATHRTRIQYGPTHRAPSATTRPTTTRDRPDNVSTIPTRSQPISTMANRNERPDEPYRPQGSTSSQLSSSQPRRADPPPRSSSLVAPTNTSQQDSIMTDRYQSLEAPGLYQSSSTQSRSLDPDRHRSEDASVGNQGRVQLEYTQTQTQIQTEETRAQYAGPPYNLPNSGKQYRSQSGFTQEQRKEMEQRIIRALKEKGLSTVTREQLDDAIDRALQRQADDPGSQPDTTQSVGFQSKYATSGAADSQRHRRRD